MKRIVAIILVTISLLVVCVGCKPTQKEEIQHTIYRIDDDCYFKADCRVLTPALENFVFSLPLVTKEECKSFQDLIFYYQNEKLEIEAKELTLIKEYSAETAQKSQSDIDGYRYTLSAELNSKRIDTLLIDKVIAKLDGIERSFNVDIKIVYQYLPIEQKLINNYSSCKFDVNNNMATYSFDFYLSTQLDGVRISNIHFETLDNSRIRSIKVYQDDSINKQELSDYEQVGLAVGYKYCFELTYAVDKSNDYFVNDNVFFTLAAGLINQEYSTNCEQLRSCIYSCFAEQSTTKYFSK